MNDAGDFARLRQAVQRAFVDGPPNGWLLGWPIDRFATDIEQALKPDRVTNYSSFDYSYCNQYEVTKTLGSDRWVLTVLISYIADVYIFYWTRISATRGSGVVALAPAEFARLGSAVEQVLTARGFRTVPDAWLQESIDVHLELSENADVTLGKCLFRDYDG